MKTLSAFSLCHALCADRGWRALDWLLPQARAGAGALPGYGLASAGRLRARVLWDPAAGRGEIFGAWARRVSRDWGLNAGGAGCCLSCGRAWRLRRALRRARLRITAFWVLPPCGPSWGFV